MSNSTPVNQGEKAMEKKSPTFLHALKLWLIWNIVADMSLVVFVVGFVYAPDIPIPLVLVGISLVVGMIQWLAFIPRIKHSYWWILATALGWFVAEFSFIFYIWAAEDAWPTIDFDSIAWYILILVGATAGAVIGLLQWLVMWRQVRGAGWWILGSVLGWSTVGCATYVLFYTDMGMLGVVVVLSFMGMITGVAYAYLFTQPSQKRLSYSG